MAIESVSSATYASQLVTSTQTRQTEQSQQAEQTRQASAPREPEPLRNDNEAAQSQVRQPVVNAQGQMTGKVINTVA